VAWSGADPIVSETENGKSDANVWRSSFCLSRSVTVLMEGASASSSTANSSPPMRATMSDSRKVASSARGAETEGDVAGVVTKAVVDGFQMVDVPRR